MSGDYMCHGINVTELQKKCEAQHAEIAKLRAALQAVDDHGRALSFVETLNSLKDELWMAHEVVQNRDAEIEVLTNDLAAMRRAAGESSNSLMDHIAKWNAREEELGAMRYELQTKNDELRIEVHNLTLRLRGSMGNPVDQNDDLKAGQNHVA
jgi:chromosome segregation ATPase